jgi:hypothetical protein
VPFLAAAHPVEKLLLFLREGLDTLVVDLPEKVVHPLVVVRTAGGVDTILQVLQETFPSEGYPSNGCLQVQQSKGGPPQVGEVKDAWAVAAAGGVTEDQVVNRTYTECLRFLGIDEAEMSRK